MIAIGFSPILVRFATDVEPMTLAALRTLFAALILLPFWYQRRTPLAQLKSNGVDIRMVMLAGFCLGLHLTFWIASLHYTSIASATVLVSIQPVLLIVAESLFFKRRFAPVVWTGVLLACFGAVWLGVLDMGQESLFVDAPFGNFLALVAAVIFVFYFLIGRKIRQKAEWIDYVFHLYLHAAVTCIVLTLIWSGGLPYLSSMALLVGLGLAIGPTIIGHGSINYAVKYISPTLISTLILSEIVFAAVMAYFLFQESPGTWSVVAMITIVSGVVLSLSHKAETLPEKRRL